MTEILSLRCHLNHCFLLRSIIAFPNGSSCPAHIPVPYIVAYAHATCLRAGCSSPSHRGRYPRPRCPIWIPPLSIPIGLPGEVDRDSCIRAIVRRVEESLRHRLFARVVCLLKCHALFLSSSGGKTPLIIVAMFGMFAIASLTWLHRRRISRLHHVEVQRPTSKPCDRY